MRLGVDDVPALARGCAVLGTGGGGDTAAVELMVIQALHDHGDVEVIGIDELPAAGIVMPCGGIGAPVVSFEKLESGDEGPRLRDEVERLTGAEVVALMPSEIGGSNGLVPVAWAASTGLPVLDADGMGRAFPEVQMVTMELAGVAPGPAVLTDERGNVAVLHADDGRWLERLERAVCVEMGGTAQATDYLLEVSQVPGAVIPGSITRALAIGRALEDAAAPVRAVVDAVGASVLVTGKVTDVDRRVAGGFVRGRATIEGLAADRGRSVVVEIQNENLVAREGERLLAIVPDLITIVDSETGDAVPTERLRYGQRVVVLAWPCDPRWRTPRGLEVAGPRAFGYDLDHVPVEDLGSGSVDG